MVANGHERDGVALADEFEIKPVRVDEIRQSLGVAAFLFLAVVARSEFEDILPNVLGLAPANGNAVAAENEIGHANVHQPVWLVDNGQIGIDSPNRRARAGRKVCSVVCPLAWSARISLTYR